MAEKGYGHMHAVIHKSQLLIRIKICEFVHSPLKIFMGAFIWYLVNMCTCACVVLVINVKASSSLLAFEVLFLP